MSPDLRIVKRRIVYIFKNSRTTDAVLKNASKYLEEQVRVGSIKDFTLKCRQRSSEDIVHVIVKGLHGTLNATNKVKLFAENK